MEKEILILDKKLNIRTQRDFISGFACELLHSGYKILCSESLEKLREKGKVLADYKIILAHPSAVDAAEIYNEIGKRKDFRVIVYGGNKVESFEEEKFLRVRESGQSFYCHWPEKGEILKLIEKGW